MLSVEHLITVAVIVVAITVLVAAARLRPGPWTEFAARALALLIVVNEVGWWVWAWQRASRFRAPTALWTRRQLLAEVTYFWGIAGTANGIISPDIGDHFPSYPFFQYFIQHGAIPAAALFLVVGLRIYPRPWAAVRVFALSVALVALDALANLLTNGNYMFLRSVPPGANLNSLVLATYSSTDAQGFTGFQSGSSFVGSVNTAANYKGYAHFGTGAPQKRKAAS